jgi:hypothetical protein
VEFFDSDNDLPFREWALGVDRLLPGDPGYIEQSPTRMTDWFATVVSLHHAVTSQESFDALFAHIDTEVEWAKDVYALAMENLDSADTGERAAAAHILGQLGRKNIVFHHRCGRQVIAAAGEESDPDVLWAISVALAYLTHPDAVPVLVALAGHAGSDIRFHATQGLCRAGRGPHRAEVLATLRDLAVDPAPAVREEAERSIDELSRPVSWP